MESGRLRRYQAEVRPEMLDYNGHMTEGWYVLHFGRASDCLYEQLGAGASWREATGGSLYTVEAHLRYLREVALGALVHVSSQLVGFDAKRVHFVHEMECNGEVVATEELMALCVDTRSGRTANFETPLTERLQALCSLPPPPYAGRRIALPAGS